MRSAYRVIAHVIAVLVGVQAASHAWGSAGLGRFIAEGGVIDKAFLEAEGAPPFPELYGLMIHGMNGMMVIPGVALVLLIVGFFAKFRGAVTWAAIVVGLVALQVTLGLLGHGLTVLALLHGLNALVLFAAALGAGRVARRASESAASSSAPVTATV